MQDTFINFSTRKFSARQREQLRLLAALRGIPQHEALKEALALGLPLAIEAAQRRREMKQEQKQEKDSHE